MKELQNKPYVLDLNVINNTKVVLALFVWFYASPYTTMSNLIVSTDERAHPRFSFQPTTAFT